MGNIPARIPPVWVQWGDGGQPTAGGNKYGKYSRKFPYLLIYLGSGRVTEKYEVTENVDLLDYPEGRLV